MAENQFNEPIFQAMAKNMPGAIFAIDKEAKMMLADGKALAQFGINPEQAIGMFALDVFKDYPDILDSLHRGLAGDEHIARTRVGNSLFEFSYSPIQDPNGKLTNVLAIASEIKSFQGEGQGSIRRRSYEIEVSRQVAQEISTATDVDELMPLVVRLVKERFNYYHAQIFRYDPGQDAVVLVVGYGDAGKQMLEAGHKVSMGRGVVGMAAQTGQAILATDVAADHDWQSNPNLPETKGELAVPIKFRDEILGILDVQSDQANTLSQDDVLLLENLAGQIAVAIEHTRTLEEANAFHALVEASGQGIGFADTQGKFVYANSSLARLFGANSAKDLIGKDVIDFYPEEEHQRFQEMTERVFQTGQWTGELNIRPLNSNSIISSINNVFQIKDRKGNLRYIANAITDISEQKLAQTRLSEALRAAHLAYWDYDVLNNLFTFNDQFYALLRTTAAEQGGYQMSAQEYSERFVHPEDAPLVGKEIQTAIESSDPTLTRQIDHRIIYADGQPGYITVRFSIEKDATGRTIRTHGANQDITERHAAEEALFTSQRQLAEAMSVARIANWEFDFVKGEFIFNDNFYNLFHTTAEEQGGYRMTPEEYSKRFVHPDDSSIVSASIEHVLASRELHQSVVVDHRILYADGNVGFVSARVNVDKDEQGNLLRYYGANQDITERHAAEEALRTSEQQLAEAMNVARIANWEFDFVKGEFIFNDNFYNLFHTTAEEQGGYRMTPEEYSKRFVHPDDSSIVSASIEHVLASRELHQSVVVDHRILYADGGVGFVSARVNVDKDEEGNLLRYYGANQDITERKKADMETQETLRELERLYQSTSHGGWENYLDSSIPNAYLYDNFNIESKDVWTPEIASAIATKTIAQADTQQTVVAPLTVRGEIIGTLGLMDAQYLSDEDLAMLESISEQVALALESARLFEQTQQALGQANTFKQLVNATTQGIGMANLEAQLVYANEALIRIFGEENVDDIIGKELAQFYPERTKDFINQQVLNDVRGKNAWTGELDIAAKSGKEIATINNLFLVKDDNNNPQFIANVITDITDQKQAEEVLRRQNEYLATAGDVSRLISSTLDLSTLFERTVSLVQSRFKYYHVAIFTVEETGFNAVLREATGPAGNEMKKNLHSLPVGSKSIIGYVTGNGETLVVNNTALDPIHRPNPLLPETLAEAGIPLKIGSRIIGALDIQSKDVNAFRPEDIAVLQTLADQIAVGIDNARSFELAQKAVAEMREIDRIKSQFLANMSHELRTPLNSIIGFSRVILKGIDGPVTDQQHQDLNAIYNSGQHLLGLINDILDLSKIEAGKMDLAMEEMNISDTINSVMSTAVGLVKDKTIKLKQEVPANLPTIRADPMRMRQILLNLIANAAKFTDEGSITVNAVPHTSPSGQMEVMISVIDTGPGISAEDQAKLFQAFSQVDSSPTRRTGGTGLGLSICQRFVQMHGGRIGVHSVAGKGSTFYFTIPQFNQPSVEAIPGQGKVILCIDDDQQVIGLYDRYLKPQGYQVIPVTNPAAARDTIKRFKPYAVTLDVMMPEIDGWSLLEELKADPETRNIPIIICSIIEEEEKGFSLGASDYLVKPILEDDLLGSLHRLNGDGTIKEVLIIDDSADDLRLMEKIIAENTKFRPALAEGGEKGWEMILNERPHAIILDLFMPDLNGFTILERLRTTTELRDIPVIVVSGVDLTPDQKKQLDGLGKRLLQKGMLNEKELFATLTKALKRLEPS